MCNRRCIFISTHWLKFRSRRQILDFTPRFYQCRSILGNRQNYSVASSRDIKLNVDESPLKDYLTKLVNRFRKLQEMSVLEKVDKNTIQEITRLQPVMNCYEEIERKNEELSQLQQILNEDQNQEMVSLARQEIEECKLQKQGLEVKILNFLMSDEPMDENDIILEITAGVGGQEAMLFSQDLAKMYTNLSRWKGWHCEVLDEDTSDIGGIRHISFSICGKGVYKFLKFEAGVHRVQRIPHTEKSGRIHTSTSAVAVLPQPREIEIDINPRDIKVEAKRSSGAGGQHVNKTETAIRMTHLPSEIVVDCQRERSQIQNKAIAMLKLRAKLYQIQIEERLKKVQSTRKIQIGTSGRSEKIRTYNFPQDRITDHRIGSSFFNMKEFLLGEEKLDNMIAELLYESKKEILMEVVFHVQKNC